MIEIDRKVKSKAANMKSDHIHESNELYFLISGGRRYFIGHKIFDVVPGSIVLIPKNELHRTGNMGVKGYDRFVIMFDDNDVNELIESIGRDRYDKLLTSGCLLFSDAVSKAIKSYFEDAQKEDLRKQELYQAHIKHDLYGILLAALRYGKQMPQSNNEMAVKIQSAAQYISENFYTDVSLESAARAACMETTYFSKRFKKLTGFGFSEYLTSIRIREAKRMLKDTDLKIGDISEMCGFSCSNYFGDVFKRLVKMSPTEYRTKTKPML